MKKIIVGLALAAGLLVLPDVSVARPSGTVLAQSFGVEIGPGEPRFERDNEGYRDRPRYGERERFRERRWNQEREFDRPGVQRFYQPRRQCRTVLVRRETPYGVRVQRIRRCY